MHRTSIAKALLGAVFALLVIILIYQIPPVHERLAWRLDFTLTYIRGVFSPPGAAVPTPRPIPTGTSVPLHVSIPTEMGAASQPAAAAASAGPTPTALPPTPVPTPIPSSAH
ncbi:MAG TPA: hypothetical protein VF813_05045, partial [Anaerolineaceae bacterium]